MENLIQTVSVPVIAAIVYGAMALYKYTVGKSEKLIRLIPVIAVTLGVILGVIAFYAAPTVIPADNVLTAILVGGSSGLAATGTHQIFKQLLQKATSAKKAGESTINEEDLNDDGSLENADNK